MSSEIVDISLRYHYVHHYLDVNEYISTRVTYISNANLILSNLLESSDGFLLIKAPRLALHGDDTERAALSMAGGV